MPEAADSPSPDVDAAAGGGNPAPATARSWAFEAIGTRWQVDAEAGLTPELRHEIDALIDRFDRTWSRFRDDSLVTRMSREPGRYEPDDDGRAMLACYAALVAATDGALTPLVGRALEHLGYDAHYSLRRRPGPVTVPRWREAVTWDGTTLTVHEPVMLDVGAVGKGRLVDRLADLLEEAGHREYTIDAGGDLRHRGERPIHVALEDPADTTRAIGIVQLRDGALCASGTNRRAWGPGLHHILDGRTGRPVTHVVATWACAPTAMAADAAASALFFLPPHRVPEASSAARMSPAGTVEHRDLNGRLFIAESQSPALAGLRDQPAGGPAGTAERGTAEADTARTSTARTSTAEEAT